jgi:hypothetical protein
MRISIHMARSDIADDTEFVSLVSDGGNMVGVIFKVSNGQDGNCDARSQVIESGGRWGSLCQPGDLQLRIETSMKVVGITCTDGPTFRAVISVSWTSVSVGHTMINDVIARLGPADYFAWNVTVSRMPRCPNLRLQYRILSVVGLQHTMLDTTFLCASGMWYVSRNGGRVYESSATTVTLSSRHMHTVEERIWYTKYILQHLTSAWKVTDTEQVSQGTIEGQEDEAIGQIGINMSALGEGVRFRSATSTEGHRHDNTRH